MKRAYGAFLSFVGIAIVSVFYIGAHMTQHTPPVVPAVEQKTLINDALSLVVEPDDGMHVVTQLIDNAKTSVDLVMYELDDATIERALANASARGVSVHVLLATGYQGAPSKINTAAYTYFQAHHVSVQWTPTYFALTHQKTLIVDKDTALIMTFNLVSKYYSTGRDFGVLDRDPTDVSAIETAFESDWNGTHVAAPNGDDLVWSPGSSDALVALIDSAKQSLLIYNEEMDDVAIEYALEAAAHRGVSVEVLMTYSSQWKKAFSDLVAAGVSIHTYSASVHAPLYIHAKMVLVDNATAFLGSENFSYGSLASNRELGIVFSKPDILTSLETVFNSDWGKGTAFSKSS